MKVDPSQRLWKEEDRIFYHEYVRMMQQRRAFIRFVLSTALILSLLVVFSSRLFGAPAQQQSSVFFDNLSSIEKMKKFNDLIISGDDYLIQGDYKQATRQYRLALYLFPHDSIATFRLISASGLNCKVNSEDCSENLELLEAYVER